MNDSNHDATDLSFLTGCDAVGALMREHDWSTFPLGHPGTWPHSLRTVVGMMLNSKFPMFLAWGPEMGFLYNASYAEILGTKHPAALGRPFQEVWPEIWTDVQPIAARALAGEASYYENLPLVMRRRGYDEKAFFTFSYSPVRDESGAVAGMCCVCVETTEQVLAETYRTEENERFRTLFEQAPGFMAILRGPDHVFELTNHAYCQLVGHRDILGRSARDALPEVVEQGFIDLLDKVCATGEPFIGRAIPIKLQREPNGLMEERFIDFVYQPIRDERGSITGIFAEGSDVTERKLAEEELRRVVEDLALANQRQREFLATLAHELRNPLAPICAGLDLMRMNDDNPTVATKVRDMMDRQVNHLVHLVNDLLDVARINTGQIDIKKERVRLQDIVSHAVEMTLPALQAKHHNLSVQMSDESIWLDADANRLAQVIGNLLANSAKFSPDNGKIDLSILLEGNEAVIAVADNGMGISADSLPHIFDMFTQFQHAEGHHHGGLGIGLSLVKRLTEQHAGSVRAYSPGPGQGATFVLRFPTVQCKANGVAGTPATPDLVPDAQRSLRILIVDDNRDAAQSLQQLLEIGGHTVRTAHDGEVGLNLAQQFVPDLGLLDIGLPGMDGYALASAIRQLPQSRSMHLVAITGWGAQGDRERSQAAGFNRHLTKPINIGDLHHIVSELASSSE
jgi:PAS domain S-box-containing protein